MVHTFPKNISPKVDVMMRREFELAVLYFSHDAKENLQLKTYSYSIGILDDV